MSDIFYCRAIYFFFPLRRAILSGEETLKMFIPLQAKALTNRIQLRLFCAFMPAIDRAWPTSLGSIPRFVCCAYVYPSTYHSLPLLMQEKADF